jgi:hypothetical protein
MGAGEVSGGGNQRVGSKCGSAQYVTQEPGMGFWWNGYNELNLGSILIEL